MQQPQQSIDLKIKGNVYTIKYPNTGDLIDISVMKARLSNGRYDTLKYSVEPDFVKAALIIDACAVFQVLVPKLREDLNVKTIFDLTEEQMNDVLEVYVDTYVPWYEEWKTFLSKPKEQKENAA